MKSKNFLLYALLILFSSSSSSPAYWVWSPEAGKFINTESAGKDSAQEQYDYAMKLYKEENLEEALEKFKDLVKKHPNAKSASEAQYRLGIIHEERGDYLKAFRAYKKLIETYPHSERFGEVIEREFRIGNLFLSGKKAKFAGLEILPSLPRAAEVFEHIGKHAPFSEYGDKAQFQLGVTNRKWGRFADALKAFQEVIDQYPQSELVSQARYQLAETSYLRSSAEFRNQRALDEASTQVNRFLDRYPDSNISEKAAKLRQAIDEKNAEKNYRIAVYYEKQNYLQSALIYYTDVSKRYPGTQWGSKSLQKLKTLKEPAKYFSNQEKELNERLKSLEARLENEKGRKSGKGWDAERKLLKERQKLIEKNKKESLKVREQDIARRKRELKEKFKNLEKKRKLMGKNPSEDFKRAMERWHASLIGEQEALLKEKGELTGWRQELGVRDKKFGPEFLPFAGEKPSELEAVRRLEAKGLYKLSRRKKALLEKKELLYKHRSEIASLLGLAGSPSQEAAGKDKTEAAEPAHEGGISEQKKQEMVQEMRELQKELDHKIASYEAHYGTGEGFSVKKIPSQFVSASAGVVTKSIDKSLQILNPFDRPEARDAQTQQRLLEHHMHLKEKIATQQNIVRTLTEAFDAQLAFEERQRLLTKLESADQVDLMELRKSIKALEKEIRASYEEIADRHPRKKDLLEQLENLLKEEKSQRGGLYRAARAAGRPAAAGAKFFRSFLFGLPHKEVELTQEAAKLSEHSDTEEIKKIRQEIELESLLIEGKSKDIVNRQKELEILKTKASLAGGYKFRPVLVRVPYLFIEEAIASAKRVIPRKNRAEMIIHKLNQETRKLEESKAELRELERRIEGLEVDRAPGEHPEEESASEASKAPAEPAPDETTMKKEIEALGEKLEIKKEMWERERAVSGAASAGLPGARPIGEQKKLQGELKEIEDDLARLIEREKKLEQQEFVILEKRIQKIDQVVSKLQSKMLSQDLLTERERIENRLSQLASRRDFLSQELRRFDPVESAAARS